MCANTLLMPNGLLHFKLSSHLICPQCKPKHNAPFKTTAGYQIGWDAM